MTVPDFFEQDRTAVEAALQELLPPEHALPTSIHRAMRYSVFAGGKRIRPILCMEAARMFSADQTGPVHVGCALEFIHTYSLIHDDLPALDNDDLRRGKPTNHKVFGEAIAILAGDALLTLAFQTLAMAPVDPQRRLTILAMVAEAAGTDRGMIGGQVADLEAEGKPSDKAMLEYIHRSKTAALIRAAIVAEVAKIISDAIITVIDWAEVLAVTRANAEVAGVQDRLRVIAGNAFDVDWGGGFDLVLLANFLHHFSREDCVTLLSKVKTSLSPRGQVMAIDFVPNPDRVSPPIPAMFAFSMLAQTPSGDAYTLNDLDGMARDAGFGGAVARPLSPTPETLVVFNLR